MPHSALLWLISASVRPATLSLYHPISYSWVPIRVPNYLRGDSRTCVPIAHRILWRGSRDDQFPNSTMCLDTRRLCRGFAVVRGANYGTGGSAYLNSKLPNSKAVPSKKPDRIALQSGFSQRWRLIAAASEVISCERSPTSAANSNSTRDWEGCSCFGGSKVCDPACLCFPRLA